MKSIKIIVTVLFMTVLGSTAMAQIVSPVDFMINNPRSTWANPAFYTKDYGYFDLGLGGINIGVQNIGLKYDKFFRFNEAGQPTVVDLNSGVASLRDVNYVNSFVNFDIFSCGRRTKHGYFTYTHRFRELESLSYNKDLVQLLAQGNAAFLGDNHPADIKLGVSARVFQEFDFGYQMCLTEQWNIGIRLKFLMGFMDAKTNAMNVKLYTNPDTYALRLVSVADVRGSIPYQIVMENGEMSIVDRRFNPANLFKNYGGGIDLGGEYIINDQWGVAAAINDLGFIKWNNYAYNFVGELQDNGSFYDNGAFLFPGLSEEQVNAIINDPDYAGQMADSLIGYLNLNPQSLVAYTSGLNANFMVRGYYDLTPQNRFSAQFMGYNMGLGIKPAMTLAYTGSFADKYDVVATYTMMPGSFDNLGIGLSANFGGMLLYVASNNILAFFNPANRSMLHAQFGISLTSGDLRSRAENIIIKAQAKEEELENEEEQNELQQDPEKAPEKDTEKAPEKDSDIKSND